MFTNSIQLKERLLVNNVRTVSDTKRAFYGAHTRPISAIYRRVVEELMVEMHLLLVNVDFAYDSIFALGVISVFDRFMAGYQPEADRPEIYTAIIKAVEGDPEQYRRDAQEVIAAGSAVPSIDAFKSLLEEAKSNGSDALKGNLHKVITNPKFKYSRLFATGLYNVLEAIDSASIQDKDKREALLDELAETLGFNNDLLKKDVDLYRGNLETMAQAQAVMQDMVEAEKKKKAKREAEKQARDEAKAKAAAEPTDTADTSVDGEKSETKAE
ncbi:MAG: photosystem II biogenesis protein Psp29 [Phormidesmis priestleyi Ana]|uniref:Protein Thf1 n=1 Tax=Phormidesmis priestleyi Ana TaxID=1666911 RepID=A0A0P7YWM0_9CYAN|nr:MAG: photosystem II biogenesis protein Psp29 [Phormidesmis priestleyi Ana]